MRYLKKIHKKQYKRVQYSGKLLIEFGERRPPRSGGLRVSRWRNRVKTSSAERRPPRSGGWQVSRRRSRVKTSSASGARRAAAAGGQGCHKQAEGE